MKLERFTSKINVQGKCVMHLQSCCFANHDYLLLFQCRSRCCRRRRLKLFIALCKVSSVMFFVGFHLQAESLYSHKDLCPFSINLWFVSFIRSTLLPRDLLLDLFPITDGRELFAVGVHENGADLKKLRTKVIFVALVKSTCGNFIFSYRLRYYVVKVSLW